MILESKIQSQIINFLESEKWIVVKTIVLNRSGYPDIFAFKDSIALFVEVKSEKGILSELQKYRIESLTKNKFKVIISNSIIDFKTKYKDHFK